MELLDYMLNNPGSILILIFFIVFITFCLSIILKEFKPITFITNATYLTKKEDKD